APLSALVDTWRDLRASSKRLEKRERLARLFTGLETSDLLLAVHYLSGHVGRDAPGAGAALVHEAMHSSRPAGSGSLTIADVDEAIAGIASASGPGSIGARGVILRKLFGAATGDEREFISALILGELRQGALRSLVLDALAPVLGVEAGALRRAVMFAGLRETVEAARVGGAAGLDRFRIAPLVPVGPMLASPAGDPAEALADLGGRAAAEWKLDGIRVQLHRLGNEVRVFTRSLRDVTDSSPELVEFARTVPAEAYILDGEVVAFGDENRPAEFQDLMSRFHAEGETSLRLEPVFFDLLYLDNEPWVDHPDRERRSALEKLLPEHRVVRRRIVESVEAVESVLAESRAAGHEGLVLKALDAPYAAGRRGSNWRKLRPAHTVDLVILAAEWGHGRRQGLLSNLHLGARYPQAPGRFWMLGKTFKGLTDSMLRELTQDLPKIALESGPHVVRVRPERVVEIAFDGVQRSPRYDSGLALRFARVKRFRPDKSPHEATTLEEIRQLARRKG
ncbi:MAG TPA: ATP-dependent DNA ligase, partial [Candidatus Polarisedimenticolia bacterium]|nr:ATP-dependent DNA ligase [Candidatus Polarisedimenticolia bacterium]